MHDKYMLYYQMESFSKLFIYQLKSNIEIQWKVSK